MYDFIKMQIKGSSVERIFNNGALNWYTPVNLHTGAVRTTRFGQQIRTAEWNTLSLMHIRNNDGKCTLFVKGSFHKMFQCGTNADDFTYSDFKTAIQQFLDFFTVNLEDCEVRGFEFGINLMLPYPAQVVLQNILDCKGKPRDVEYTENMQRFRLAHYTVKIYGKGLQCNRSPLLLRVEIHTHKLQFLTKRGIQCKTLRNLLAYSTVASLYTVLLALIDDLLIYEPALHSLLKTASERAFIRDHKDSRTWRQLHGNERQNAKKKYHKIVSKYLGNNTIGDALKHTAGMKAAHLLNRGIYHLLPSCKQIQPYHLLPLPYTVTSGNYCLK